MPTFDFGGFPTLRTDRLDLVAFDVAFVEDIFAVRSDPVVQLYNSEPHRAREETLGFINEQLDKYARHQEITWGLLLREQRRLVGCVTCSIGIATIDALSSGTTWPGTNGATGSRKKLSVPFCVLRSRSWSSTVSKFGRARRTRGPSNWQVASDLRWTDDCAGESSRTTESSSTAPFSACCAMSGPSPNDSKAHVGRSMRLDRLPAVLRLSSATRAP